MSEQQEHERPEVIYLVATTGNPNYGDEYIAASWLRFLAKQRPDAEVIIDCQNPGLATHLLEGLHPRLRFTDMLWRVVWQTMEMDADEGVATVDRLVTELGTPRFDFGLIAARRATTVHVTGGGHMTAHWPHHSRLLRAARRLAEVSQARFVTTGLGLFPALDVERMREDLATADHATVRDEVSAGLVGVEAVCDDSLLGLPALPGFGERSGPVASEIGDVYVSLQRDLASPEGFEASVEATRELLQRPELAGRTVHYVEALPGTDKYAWDRLGDLIPAENFLPFVKLWSGGFPGRPRQTWITTRFHFHLFAAACGADGVVLLIDDDYYRTKHESVLEAGSGWAVAEVGSEVLPDPAGNVEFRLTAGRLHRAKLDEAEKLYPRKVAPRPVAPEPVPTPQPVEKTSGWLLRRR